MKKIILILLLITLMIIAPFVAVGAYAFGLSPFYEQSYLGAMADKFDRLNSIDSPKIILVGGSSMAFGIDSTALEKELGMPVVNMALYAAIGSKTTLELTKSNVNKGDIIIFAPETDSQAYSMYFDAMTTLQMLDANKKCFGNYPSMTNSISLPICLIISSKDVNTPKTASLIPPTPILAKPSTNTATTCLIDLTT